MTDRNIKKEKIRKTMSTLVSPTRLTTTYQEIENGSPMRENPCQYQHFLTTISADKAKPVTLGIDKN